MGKYVLRDGERALFRGPATDARKHVAGSLVLTDQRIMLLTSGYKKPGVLAVFFGILGLAVSAMAAQEQITTQIERADVAGVELIGPGTLKVFNNGDGYGYIWFEVHLENAVDWIAAIRHWVEHGDVPGSAAAKLPVAKVVKPG